VWKISSINSTSRSFELVSERRPGPPLLTITGPDVERKLTAEFARHEFCAKPWSAEPGGPPPPTYVISPRLAPRAAPSMRRPVLARLLLADELAQPFGATRLRRRPSVGRALGA